MGNKTRVKELERRLQPENVYCIYFSDLEPGEPEPNPEDVTVTAWVDGERKEMSLSQFRELYPEEIEVHFGWGEDE
jgi:hypothetical protein